MDHLMLFSCMAVLQRQPHYIEEKGINSLKKIYPFEKFEQQIVELDKSIKPQGLSSCSLYAIFSCGTLQGSIEV